MICIFRMKWTVVSVASIAMLASAACRKDAAIPFPATNEVVGWEKTDDTRIFQAKDLWQYMDGGADQYIQAGVISTATSDYKYHGALEAVVDVHTLHDASEALKLLQAAQAGDSKSISVGDAGFAYAQSIAFRKGRHLVRIVAYQSTPDGPQALLALARGMEAKL